MVMIVAPAVIALREGIEAALIIAIMLAYVRKTKQSELRNYVVGGALLAIFSSIGIAWVMGAIWGIFEGPMLNIFEGTVVLIAAVLLSTMVLWMWRVGSNVASDIQASMKKEVTMQNSAGVALLSFALILREGVELVLFTMALVFQEGIQTYIGIALGLLIAIGLGLGIYQGSLRISLKSLFKWTSVFLVLFAAGMIAYGVHELQEAGLLLFGPIEIWNINTPQLPDGSYPLLHENGLLGGLAKSLFGYNGNPSALEVIAYVSYLVGVSIYYISKRNQNIMNAPKDDDEGIVQVTQTITPRS
jgi:high-affinity iron transporter